MATTGNPVIFISESNEDALPKEVGVPLNINAGHGGATALLLASHERNTTSRTQLQLLQSGFNTNAFNAKVIATSGLGLASSKDERTRRIQMADLLSDGDGNLLMQLANGTLNASLFSNQAIFTNRGRFPQRDSNPEGLLEVTVGELGFTKEGLGRGAATVSFLVACSTKTSKDSQPVACCYLVEIATADGDRKLDVIPGGKCGPREMTNSWKFNLLDGDGLRITGPADSHFVFFCNRSYADDVEVAGPCGKVSFSQAYNGEHPTVLLPKIGSHYGRALLVLCSRSCPQTSLVTSALYLVSPLYDNVGVYYIAESTEDPSLANPALWTVSKRIGKLVIKLKPNITGPCQYAFISNAVEDVPFLEKRCLQDDCLATGAEKPLTATLSIQDGQLRVWMDQRVTIKLQSSKDIDYQVVDGSELAEEAGGFGYKRQLSEETSGLEVFRAFAVLTNKAPGDFTEKKPVEQEMKGSPCRIVRQARGVQFAANFGGPVYESSGGVVFQDGRSAVALVCQSSDNYYYGCHIDSTANHHGMVANTQDGVLFTTYLGRRLASTEGVTFKISLPAGKYSLTLYIMSEGLKDCTVSIDGEDVTSQVQDQLMRVKEVIPGCTARTASVPMTVSQEGAHITFCGPAKISAMLIHDATFEGGAQMATAPSLSEDKKQELGDDLPPLDRHIAAFDDVWNLGWSGDLLRVTSGGDLTLSGEWKKENGGDGVQSSLVLLADEGELQHAVSLGALYGSADLDKAPTIKVSESFRSPYNPDTTFKLTLTLIQADGTVVQEKTTAGCLDGQAQWTRMTLDMDGYGAGVRAVKIHTQVSGRHAQVSATSFRIRLRRQNRGDRKDWFRDVNIEKDPSKVVALVRHVVQKFGDGRERIQSEDFSEEQSADSPITKQPTTETTSSVGDTTTSSEPAEKKKRGPKKKREIRVFVSSTFLDFAAERELLIKKVFGEVRKMCSDRGVFFSYVDLRWGITSDQSNDGQTISICLREIDRCRPYFLCLMGDRFGWSQDEDSVDELLNKSFDYAIENFPQLRWIQEHRYRCSVTQLEVYHAALRQRDQDSDRTFFYLRKPKTEEELKQEARGEPEWKRLQQRKLREAVQQSGLPVRHYTLAQEGATLIQQDLERCINEEFPPESKLSPLQREREAHISFAEVRRRVYIGREEYFTRINDYILGNPDRPLVILGESGSGKSALVANWCGRFEEAHPDDFLFMHFIGSSADSASHLRLIRRLYEELKQHFQLEMSVPTSDKALVQELPKWLATAGSFGRRVVVVLDALNQLDSGAVGQGDEQELMWLPGELPPNVQLLLSTLPGKALDAVTAAGWPVFHVQPLSSGEKAEIITLYMELYAKSLSEEQTALIVDAAQTSNALYLKALLDEIRVYGSYYELTAAIKDYLKASDPGQLFVKILERLESDFEGGEHGRPSLVRDTTSAIWCCSRGMSEQELRAFLQVPSRVWSPFYLSLEENLVNRNGIVNFFHDHLRQAVERKYVATSTDKRKAFTELADFFEKQDIDERYVEELPFLLMELKDLSRLKAVVMNPAAFQLLMKSSEGEARLIQAWRMLGGFEQAGQAYLEFINHSQAFRDVPDKESFLDCLTDFFMELGILRIARQVNEQLLNALETLHAKDDPCQVVHHVKHERTRKSRHQDIIENLLDLGQVCQKLADYPAAIGYFEDALARLSKPRSSAQQLQMVRALTGLGQVYDVTYRPLEACGLFQRAKELCGQLLPQQHHYVATISGLIGEVYQRQGCASEALQYHIADILATQRSSGLNKPRVAAILNNIGLALLDLDSPDDDPLPFFVQALALLIGSYGLVHVDVALVRFNLAAYFFNAQLYQYSLFQYKRAAEIFKVYCGPLHPNSIHTNGGLRALRPYTLQGTAPTNASIRNKNR